MKILIGTDTFVPSVNGVVTSTVNLKAGLKELGHDVRVLALSTTGESYRDDDVYYIGSLDVGKVYPGARLKTKPCRSEVEDILQWQPDVIHTQTEFSIFFIAAKIARKLKVPLVHTYHTTYEDYTHYFSPSKTVGKKMVTVLTNLFSEHIEGMIAPAQKTFNMLKDYGVNCELKCIPSGISLDKFAKKPDEKKLEQLKTDLGISKGDLLLLSVSRVGKEKNISELVEHVKNIDNISLVIVGDGPYKQELEAIVKADGIDHKVKFTGMVKPEDVINYYSMADLFVSASTSETQGLTYIEALACGTPLLCRNDDCLNGVLEQGKNGYGFDNDEEFKQNLKMFIKNKDKMEMREYARKTSLKFSRQNFAKNAHDFYVELIELKLNTIEDEEEDKFSFEEFFKNHGM